MVLIGFWYRYRKNFDRSKIKSNSIANIRHKMIAISIENADLYNQMKIS